MTRTEWTIARQIAFFAPVDMKGKWHAAWLVSHTAVCGTAVDLHDTQAIRTTQGGSSHKVHPIVCRRCLRLSTRHGVSAIGMVR